ncbi:hypothetical protein C8Q74DRAFT_1172399, partial [Fomes fomentarius]
VEVSFLNDDPMNSDVVNSATGERLYDITTPFTLGRSKTTLRDGQGQVVAVYTRGWRENSVTYLGQTRDVSDWLQKTLALPRRTLSYWTFTAPNGKVYKWKQTAFSRSFEVTDTQTHAIVALTHSATLGILSPKRYMRIELNAELMPFLDAFVLSFVICEGKRR